jgi:SAM-dependent methyltransferase
MLEDTYETFYQLDLTHWFPSGRRRILQDLIDRFAPHPLRIADIGCGTGANLKMLGQYGSVIGVDTFPKAVWYCRQRGFPNCLLGSLPQLPFPDGMFGLVCALDVIEHIDDDAAAVRELLRICRPGGALLITVPAYEWLWSEHDDANLHKRRYTRPQLRRLFDDLDVDVVKLTHFNFLLSPPIILARAIGKLRHRFHPSTRPKFDLAQTPAPLNALLLGLFSSERFLLKHQNAPFGISIACLVRKR